jgi:hypothetical protein
MIMEASQIPFDDIETYEDFPEGGQLEGFGLSGENIPSVKPADIVDMDIAVIGFIIMDNQYKEGPDDPDKVLAYEFVDETNTSRLFWHTSKVLKRQVEYRQEAGQIPFKTKLILKESNKSGGRTYYSFV